MVEEYLTRAVRQAGARRAIGTVRGFVGDLARMRDAGYAVSSGARIAGASGVAAPVFGPDGSVVAALNVTAPTARFPAVRAIMQESVVAAAARMSRSLAIPTPGARGIGNIGVNRAKSPEAKSVRGGRND
jgi:DNA-binding IclR family transcriptional regulator